MHRKVKAHCRIYVPKKNFLKKDFSFFFGGGGALVIMASFMDIVLSCIFLVHLSGYNLMYLPDHLGRRERMDGNIEEKVLAIIDGSIVKLSWLRPDQHTQARLRKNIGTDAQKNNQRIEPSVAVLTNIQAIDVKVDLKKAGVAYRGLTLAVLVLALHGEGAFVLFGNLLQDERVPALHALLRDLVTLRRRQRLSVTKPGRNNNCKTGLKTKCSNKNKNVKFLLLLGMILIALISVVFSLGKTGVMFRFSLFKKILYTITSVLQTNVYYVTCSMHVKK